MLFGYFEETIPLSVRLFLRKSAILTISAQLTIINSSYSPVAQLVERVAVNH